ncbi:MAG TPA: endonuclease III [Miltoncostaeaceae bacterium]|nr:endonuclease III [Miltoncostaeaceae bacterium]
MSAITPRPGTRAHTLAIVAALAEAHGPRPFHRHHDPVSALITTLLSHSTTDANQDRAFARLRERYPTWDAVREAPTAEVEETVRVAGLANQKAPRIQHALDVIAEDPRGADLEWLGRVPLNEAMEFLTAIPGVGPKTAGCVMCFTFNAPVVPVDTHVHRIALRTHIVPPRSGAARAQERLSAWVPPEQAYATHMRLIRHGRTICHARNPRCGECPLLALCPTGRNA